MSKRRLGSGLTVAVTLVFGASAGSVRANDLLGATTTAAGSAVTTATAAAPAVPTPALPPVPSPTPAPVKQAVEKAASTVTQTVTQVAPTVNRAAQTVTTTAQTVTKATRAVTTTAEPVVQAASKPVQTATGVVDTATQAAAPVVGRVEQTVRAVSAPVEAATGADRSSALVRPGAGTAGWSPAPVGGQAGAAGASARPPAEITRMGSKTSTALALGLDTPTAPSGTRRVPQRGATPTSGTAASSGVDVIPLVPVAGARAVRAPQQNLLLRELGGVSALWLGSLGFLGLALVLTRSAAHQLGRRLFSS